MRTPPHSDQRHRLMPEGRRWGFGAHSVLPYLSMSLNARPGGDADATALIRNPVFAQMESALRMLRQSH